MINNKLPVMVLSEDGDLLGFIITDMSVQMLRERIDESFKSHKYNYDVEELVEDIIKEGWQARRVYLEGVEI